MKTNRIALWVGVALILGIAVGYGCHLYAPGPNEAKEIAGYFSILTDVFLRLIKMIIGPLVFSTLVCGIAKSDSKAIGRVGLKAMAWFMGISLISLLLGLFAVNLLKPGVGYNLPLPAVSAHSGVQTNGLNLKEFITHMVPKSFFEAMANNEILQVVVFSIFFGVALVSSSQKPFKTLVTNIDEISHVMLKITGYVMYAAPFGVFGAVASTIAAQGLGVLTVYAKFMGSFVLALAALWAVMVTAGYLFLGRSIFNMLKLMRVPLMIGFATATSEAAYPKVLEQLGQFGVKDRISGFVLPLGYSFNLAGAVMYTSFVALFISQVYDIPLTMSQQLSMLLVLFIASKGIAGVPRASLVVVATVLPMFNLPEAGILLILGIDHFLDMFRTATNIVGNAIATCVVAKSEGDIALTPVLEAAMPLPLEALDKVG